LSLIQTILRIIREYTYYLWVEYIWYDNEYNTASSRSKLAFVDTSYVRIII